MKNWILMFFFQKRDFFSKIVLIVQIFKKNVRILKKCTDWFKKMYGLYGFFWKKIVRIVRICFRKLYGLYGWLPKMYGFLYGLVQKSFGHPEVLTPLDFVNSLRVRNVGIWCPWMLDLIWLKLFLQKNIFYAIFLPGYL